MGKSCFERKQKRGLSLGLGEPLYMSSLQVVFSFASDSREVNQCYQQICYLEKILNIGFSVRKYKLPALKIVIRIGIKTFLSLVSLSGFSS